MNPEARSSRWTDRPGSLALLGAALLIVIAGIAWLAFAPDLDIRAFLQAHHEALLYWRDQHILLSAAIFVLLYLVIVVLSVPVNFAMTTLGGFMFGFFLGTVLATVSVTAGAILVFTVTRASFGARLRRRVLENGSSRLFEQMDRGFRRNTLSYLLVLRLVPTMPSLVSNAAPAFFGVSIRTFTIATLLAGVPSSLATAWIGASLSYALSGDDAPGIMSSPYLTGLAVFTLLVLAALPLLLKRRL